MTVITFLTYEILRELFHKLRIYVTKPMSCTSKFSSYLTMVSYFLIFHWNCSSSWVMIEFFIEIVFHYFFTVFTLFKNCFNKFIWSIFTSVKNTWLTKFLINTNKFVSKTARNVILIFFWARSLITFNTG